MILGKKTKNTLAGFILLIAWVGLIYVMVSPGRNNDISFFGLGPVIILSLILATGVGVGLLIMRLFKVSKARLGIPYIFLGMLNLASGIIGFVVLSLMDGDRSALMCTISLITGIIICMDNYIKW
jgi:hypothetical protein